MADAEEKKISKLDFDINNAIKKLETIDNKLKEISQTSEKYAKTIGNAINKSINNGVTIDTKSIQKDMDAIVNQDKVLRRKLILQNNNHNNKIQEMNHRTTLKQIEDNNKLLQSTQTISDKITNYAKTYLIYQGFNQLKSVVKETIDEMVELEYQMVEIDRVLNESSLDIDNYRDKLIQLAYDYGNSFNNVSDVTKRLAQAGFDSQEALTLTEKTLLALNTAELDAEEATSDMIAVMAQWGKMSGTAAEQGEWYGEVIDKINKVADRYPTTSEDILNALKKTSSAFNLAGASIDETIALITTAEVASQRGGKAIGTALSNITQQLKDEGRLTIAESLGLDFYTDETETQFKGIIEIFTEMSEKMQQLKDAGKENSVEMQQLLSIFTVFRRNIGASLLGEMTGEDSTYLNVLNDSLTATGYSLQENEKHMKTARAAQAQFNATLLELKTTVWDAGVESVFRDLLNLGTDLTEGITKIIDKFGLLPTVIGTATLAYTSLNKSVQGFTYNAETNSIQLNGFFKTIADGTKDIRNVNKAAVTFMNTEATFGEKLKNTSMGFNQNVKAMGKYATSLVLSTAKTIALQVATVALNAALSMGISLAITGIVTAINNWINADDRIIEKNKELIETSRENSQNLEDEITNIQELRKEYEELAKKDNRSVEENQKIYEIQEKLNELLKDTGTQVDLINTSINEQGEAVQNVNDKYDEQLSKIKSIEYEKKRESAKELKKAADAAIENQKGIDVGMFFDPWGTVHGQLQSAGVDLYSIGGQYRTDVAKAKGFLEDNEMLNILLNDFDTLDFEKQINYLTDWYYALQKAEAEGKDVAKAMEWVEENLETLESQQKEAQDALNEYNDALSELYNMLGFTDTLSSSLQAVADSYNIEGPKKLIEEIQNINSEFSNGEINIEEYFNKIQEKLGQINLNAKGEELEAYQAIFAETTKSLAEGLEGLISGLETGSINFVDYSQGVKEAADNMLALRIEQNNLELKDGVWKDAAGNVDDYANSLQNAITELEGMGDLLTVIGDNYDYISEHANEAGEAIFAQTEVGTEAYSNLANSVAASLTKMKEDNEDAYEAITDDIFEAMGTSANEVANADAYIAEALNGNAQALNAALNASASQVAASTNKVTTSMGKVLGELGKAISGFSYTISATPYISGKLELSKDKNGIPTGIKLPSFGFDITGTGGDSIKNLGAALETFGTDLTEYGSNKFTYTQLKSKQKPYKSTAGGSGATSGGSKGSGGSGGSSSDTEREAEEEYKNRLALFTDYINELEKEEQRWVNRQKELGMLSNEDERYIIQQRISRYQKYLEQLKSMTWLSTEDRLKLERQYTGEIEDLQLDYMKLLKDELEDEIDAIEKANKEKIENLENAADERINKLKEENKTAIELIEKEADAKIEALKSVEKENDRIRAKEEYERNRQAHLDDISYWEQRTGREAQEALLEARKRLEELDRDWEQQLEDWEIEDQIAQIEEKRDAEIAAIEATQEKEIESIETTRDAEIAAIEAAQEKEIAALQAVYDAKVKMYSETGKIIYDASVIESQALYNSYKTNFIDPISAELQKMYAQAPAAAVQQGSYETYTIKRGDTLSGIASRYGTTVSKLMEANPYITNKNMIYAGKTLQIPKFHEGGIVGGNQEAFALLKPNEVILKPEWAEGINRLAKMAKQEASPINNSTVIEVSGDLVRIDANIKNKTDAEYLTRKVEKMLKDKFNIKK